MSDAITTLRKAGITLVADGDKLVARPRAALTSELRGLIRTNKSGLMAEIRDLDGIEAIHKIFGIEPSKTAPVMVRCCDCISFVADTIGDGLGIGRCETNGEGARPRGRWGTRPALWARSERRCGDFRPRPVLHTQSHALGAVT